MQHTPSNRVFITRPTPPDSEIRRLLEPYGYTVEGCSLVEFKAASFELPPAFDWVFFYSSQGVRFFFEGLDDMGLVLPASMRFGAIGPGTAAALPKSDFTGDGIPETTAKAFLALAAGKRVIFPGAANSRQSVQLLLGDAVESFSVVVYDNTPVSDIPFVEAGVLIFTSPLNAQAYFSKRLLLPGQKVVAIGPTTAQALSDLNAGPHVVAPQASEAGLAIAVLSLRSKT